MSAQSGTLVLGVALLIFGVVKAQRTLSFIDRSIPATATVQYTTKSTLGVTYETADGRKGPASVSRSWFELPGAYRAGDRLAILYDPTVQPGLLPSTNARIDSWSQLWMSSLLAIALGLVFTALYCLSRLFPHRFHTETGFELGDGRKR